MKRKKFKVPEHKRLLAWVDKTPKQYQADKVKDIRRLKRAFEESRNGINYIKPDSVQECWTGIEVLLDKMCEELNIKRF